MPLWSRDGRELFYQSGSAFPTVDVNGGAFGTPHALYEGRFRPPLNANTNDDVSPDGKRFLRVRQAGPDVPLDRIQVVLAWFEELRAR